LENLKNETIEAGAKYLDYTRMSNNRSHSRDSSHHFIKKAGVPGVPAVPRTGWSVPKTAKQLHARCTCITEYDRLLKTESDFKELCGKGKDIFLLMQENRKKFRCQ
jgi:hypothetical protein